MGGRFAFALGLLVVGAIGFAIYLQSDSARAEPATAALAPQDRDASVAVEQLDRTEEELVSQGGELEAAGLDESPGTRPDPREEERPIAFSARVSDADGAPVSGALLTWTPIPEAVPVDGEAALRLLTARGRTARSDEEGRVAFDDAPEGAREGPSVVWVTHEGYEAAWTRLEPTGERALSGIEFVLSATERVVARVVDAAGEGIAGATVLQWGLDGAGSGSGGTDLAAFLVREARSDDEGRVALARAPGRQEIVATSSEGISAPWRGQLTADIELTIASTFLAMGRVVRDVDLDPTVEVTIDCHAVIGHRQVELASLSGVVDDWGPVTLPVLEADEYVFTLDGPGIVPYQAGLTGPLPGETRSVELSATFGETLWVIAVNEEGEILHDAESETEWISNGRRTTTVFQTRDDGYFFIEGLPPGVVRPTLRCEGYATMRVPEIVVPEQEPITHEFTMSRAVALRGRVVADGEPVPDFQITTWPSGLTRYAIDHTITESEDGSFELDDLEREEVVVMATSRGVGTSLPITLDLSAGPVDELLIELATGTKARGQVVDAATRDPVANAIVQLYSADGRSPSIAVGPAARSRSNGEFELDVVPAGQAAVRVSSPGFGSETIFFTGTESETADLGVVPITKHQSLRVHLLHDEGQDPGSWMCAVTGSQEREWRAFDPTGLAVLEGVGAGNQVLRLWSGDDVIRWSAVRLRPGEEWSVEVDVRGSAELRVDLAMPESEDVPPHTSIWVKSIRGTEEFGTYANVDAAGGRTFVGLQSGSYQVEAREPQTSGNAVVAAASVELRAGESRTITLDPGASWPVLRVVDAEGAPVTGALVTVAIPGRTKRWTMDSLTDGLGLLELPGLDAEEIVVALRHPEHGQQLGVVVDVRDRSKPIDLTLAARASAEFVLSDHRGPVAGVRADLFDPVGDVPIPGTFSDERGRIRFEGIAPDDYVFSVSNDAWFYVRQPVTVVEGGPPLDVRLHRACDIEILTATDGLPRPNVELELVRVETGDRLATYLRNGQIGSDSDEIRTDGAGRLGLRGVPEGELRWRVESQGEVREGSVFVRPDSTAPIVVEVP